MKNLFDRCSLLNIYRTIYYGSLLIFASFKSVDSKKYVFENYSNYRSSEQFSVLTDTDNDGIPDPQDLDDDNDGILDSNEGLCYLSSTASDNFDSPLQSNSNGNNYQPSDTFNGWTIVSGNRFNVVRVNGSGYTAGPDTAHSGSQYIDIDNGSSYIYKTITVSTPVLITASAWFSNRDTQANNYPSSGWIAKLEILNTSNNTVTVSGNNINFTKSMGQESWHESSFGSTLLPPGSYRIQVYVHDFGHVDTIHYCFTKDTDGDGIADYLDTDSDNDGCPDAVEGGGNIGQSQVNGNGNIIGSVDANGVPTLANGGQSIGDSQNAGVNSCRCYKPLINSGGTVYDTKVGITALGRAGSNTNWPSARKGAHIALEAKTKGFVLTRIADPTIITNPIDGMVVYDTTLNCLRVYVIDPTSSSNSGWKCFNIQTCPD
ncbi:hypothetical protein CHRYSEOSP005_24870 [Chryseobacterium sp. Alg-005]|uniref:hypothetical protein n=1 Tax=Chryseobacterium sp. Alg-005 TaxID=3159516 RepID=UPI0035559364